MKIFGTSMIKGIRNTESIFYLQRCHAKLRSYAGAIEKELKHNIQFPIQIDTPDIAVTHGGSNDVSPRQNQEKLTEEEIANEIIRIGSYYQDKGVNEIIISGLIYRKGQYHNSRASKVKDYFQKCCFENRFYFIDNPKIKRDGLHLLESGKVILADNFIYCLNSIHSVNFDKNL